MAMLVSVAAAWSLYHPQLSSDFKIKDNMTAGHTKLLLACEYHALTEVAIPSLPRKRS